MSNDKKTRVFGVSLAGWCPLQRAVEVGSSGSIKSHLIRPSNLDNDLLRYNFGDGVWQTLSSCTIEYRLPQVPIDAPTSIMLVGHCANSGSGKLVEAKSHVFSIKGEDALGRPGGQRARQLKKNSVLGWWGVLPSGKICIHIWHSLARTRLGCTKGWCLSWLHPSWIEQELMLWSGSCICGTVDPACLAWQWAFPYMNAWQNFLDMSLVVNQAIWRFVLAAGPGVAK